MLFESLVARNPSLGQFLRFAMIGALNTGIDFIVLNILMVVTGLSSGPYMIILNAISFSIATINSYILNKKWTFRDQSSLEEGKKFSQFLAVSLVGVTINSLIVYVGTTFIPPFFNLLFLNDIITSILGENANMEILWANFIKIAATGISLIWNFIGYKFFVFKK